MSLSKSFALLLLALVGCKGGTDADSPIDTPPKCGTEAPAEDGVVATDDGPVRGKAEGQTWVYRGIPYAKPPVGELRFKAPEPHGCFDGVLDAASFGAVCPQMEVDDQGNVTGVRGEEDCLTLNVWAPTDAASASVLFFIHGGGNVQGSSAEQSNDGTYTYDGGVLAEAEGAVVVTINYRIGHLGWLVDDELAAESPDAVSGNYGIRDQVLALEWVKRNIASFGGDPAHVLIFGESAGAVNVCNLLATPLAAGLFVAAIMESGSCHALPTETLATLTTDLKSAAGCADIACLRAMPTNDLLMALPAVAEVVAIGAVNPGPAIDGKVLPDRPLDVVESGAHNHVPLIVGVNSEETGFFVQGVTTEAQFDAALLAYAAGNQMLADLAKAEYPVADYQGSWRKAFVALTSDAKFVCTARNTARAVDTGQTEPVYRYFFTHALDANPMLAALGAWHGLELPFVFGHLEIGNYMPSDAERQLSSTMGSIWASFVDGQPDSTPAWPVFASASDDYLQLDDPIAAGQGIRTAQCDFWDTIYP